MWSRKGWDLNCEPVIGVSDQSERSGSAILRKGHLGRI